MTGEQYKALSVREFDRAAAKYESGHAGVYELCKQEDMMLWGRPSFTAISKPVR